MPEWWVHVKLMKFYTAKYKVLHLGQGKLKYQYSVGGKCIKSSPEKDLRVLVDLKLNVSQQCLLAAQEADYVLVCIKGTMISVLREIIFSLCSALVKNAN